MQLYELIALEVQRQKDLTNDVKTRSDYSSFPGRVNILLEEDKLRNMLVAQSIAEQLALRSIATRNHHIFQEFKQLFPETFEFCARKVTSV